MGSDSQAFCTDSLCVYILESTDECYTTFCPDSTRPSAAFQCGVVLATGIG